MKNKHFNRYYLLSCIGVLIASYYPLSIGVRVIADMIIDGTVLKENYPKYIIPYTPICIAKGESSGISSTQAVSFPSSAVSV